MQSAIGKSDSDYPSTVASFTNQYSSIGVQPARKLGLALRVLLLYKWHSFSCSVGFYKCEAAPSESSSAEASSMYAWSFQQNLVQLYQRLRTSENENVVRFFFLFWTLMSFALWATDHYKISLHICIGTKFLTYSLLTYYESTWLRSRKDQ